MPFDEAVGLVTARGVVLVVGVVVLLVLYRLGLLAIARIVPGFLRVQAAAVSPGDIASDDLRKRTATIQDLLGRLLRAGVWIAGIALVLVVLDLWTILAGIGLVTAALLVASQQVVTDYVMGVLILIEGPFYRGDWIEVEVNGVMREGEVQELGLRRTVLRGPDGAMHSLSNGLIRAASNLTRTYSLAVAEATVLHASDLDRALAIATDTARDLAAERGDPAAGSDPEVWVMGLSADGAVVRVVRRVAPEERWATTSELRQRLAAAYAAAGIATTRWDAPLPVEVSSDGRPGPARARRTRAAETEPPTR